MYDSNNQKTMEIYWLKRLAGDLPNIELPDVTIDEENINSEAKKKTISLKVPESTVDRLITVSKGSSQGLFILFLSGLNLVLHAYTGLEDLIVGTVSPRQEEINQDKLLFIRNRVFPHFSLRELIGQVKENVQNDFFHRDYSFGLLYQRLLNQKQKKQKDSSTGMETGNIDLFNIAFIYDQFQNRTKLLDQFGVVFILSDKRENLVLEIENVSKKNSQDILVRFGRNLIHIMENLDAILNKQISTIEVVSPQEKEELLYSNSTASVYPREKTLHQLFQSKAALIPDRVALVSCGNREERIGEYNNIYYGIPDINLHLTYSYLNRRTNQLANLLKTKGVKAGDIVGLMIDRSVDMVIAILAVLKAGGTYLPIDIKTPTHRVQVMLKDSNAQLLLTKSKHDVLKIHPYTNLRGLDLSSATEEKVHNGSIHISPPCERIAEFDSLPFPDRSLIDNEKYNRLIGQSLVKNRIVIQASRGCPHNCAYCYRIWPSKQVVRTAENIFKEIKMYYDLGIKKFDIFMLNIKQGRRLFEIIVEKQIKDLQLFFPNGFRGDLLNKEYVDLMVEAGTVNFALALETASPRLQKLINKNLNLNRFRETVEYTCKKYPHVVLELFTLHGIPTETEEEALMTLDFIKSLKWVHFPYVNVLKIYRRTPMEQLALNAGISKEAIFRSENLAWHEWSETLPFNRSFTSRYQSDFLNNYVLSRERLIQVIPLQMKILTREEFLDKYDSYLPGEIETYEDFLAFTGLTGEDLAGNNFLDERQDEIVLKGLNDKIRKCFPVQQPSKNGFRVLLLDITQFFSDSDDILYDVVDPPLGLMYILTYLNRYFGDKINGRILKPRIDFDSYEELKSIVEEFKPQVIGIRSLSYYKDFFHQSVASIREWGFSGPVIAGGPYATVDYETLLQDRNIDLAVLGEGENTFLEIIKRIMANSGNLPEKKELEEIKGIAFVSDRHKNRYDREILLMDTTWQEKKISCQSYENISPATSSGNLAYIIYTSGSTGTPKGVAVTHRNVVNVLNWYGKNYNLQPGSHVIQMSNYTFDPSVEQVLGTLFYGGTVFLAGREISGDGEAFRDFVEKHQIHIVNFVPGALRELLKGGSRLMSLQAVISGGEKLEEKVKRELLELGYTLYNHYGPTETTIDALVKRCTTGSVTLGRPLDNVHCFVILGNEILAPIGVTAELFIGGAGVTQGYLNNPELTAEKFIRFQSDLNLLESSRDMHSLPSLDYPTIYRTGDLARWLPNLEIEFVGRIDQQVKIRGLRIELGEIETKLLGLAGISDAFVTVYKAEAGNNYLCAYVVPNSSNENRLTPLDVKDYLTLQLPDYMIPAQVVLLEKFPRNLSGKIDRKALPAPDDVGNDIHKTYKAPRNEIEEIMVKVWEEVLNRNPIGIDENFFSIGGDSIKSIQIISRMRTAGYIIDMNNLFKHPTVAELAPMTVKEESSSDSGSTAALTNSKEKTNAKICVDESFVYMEQVAPLSPDVIQSFATKIDGEIEDIYPLSPMQEGMLIHFLYDQSSTAYFEQRSYRIKGSTPLDIVSVEKSLAELVKRHDILRTVFIHDVMERPMQVVLKEQQIPLTYIPLTELGVSREDSEGIELFIKKFREDERKKPFDLGKDVLMRVTIIQIEDTEYEFIWSHHHILMDGWCASILISEFFEFQRSFQTEQNHRLPPSTPYKVYIKWLEQRDRQELKDYWADYLADYNEIASVSALNLKLTGRNNFAAIGEGYENDRVFLSLDRIVTRDLKALAARNRVTLNTVMQALWGILLGVVTDRQDVVFGVVVSGRPPEVRNIEIMVGLFINTVPLRIRFDSNPSFTDLLANIQKSALESEPFHLFPLADIQSQSVLKQNLIDHIFVFENTPGDLELREILTDGNSNKESDNKIATNGENKINFEFSGFDTFEQTNYAFNVVIYPQEEMTVRFEFDGNVYERQAIQWVADHLKVAIDHVLEAETIRISQISLLTPKERKQVLEEFNRTGREFPGRKNISDIFIEQAERNPERISLVVAEENTNTSLTYFELDKYSNDLAHVLRSKGVTRDTIVGIMATRSLEMIKGIMGVLKAGGAYLPVDYKLPDKRLNYMLNDSRTKILLTMNSLITGKNLTQDVTKVNLAVDRFDSYDIENRQSLNLPNDLAQVIYTSGSTGVPKGVMLSHRNVMNFIFDFYDSYCKHYLNNQLGGMRDYLNMALIAPYIFAGSVKQIFSSLLFGHCLYIVPEEGRFNGNFLIDFFNRYKIDVTDATPAHLRLMTEAYKTRTDKRCVLRHLNLSAEILPKGLVREFINRVDGGKPDLANLYGPTECCVDATGYMINAGELEKLNTVPIGTPMANVYIYLLSYWGTPSPVGIFGEIYIGGDGVARGYLNRPALTAEKFFVSDKYSKKNIREYSKPGTFIKNTTLECKRLYRTGDIARWLPDGKLEFLGRNDRQLNIRGLRIEPGEIETAIKKYPGIEESLVIPVDIKGEAQITAYFLTKPKLLLRPSWAEQFAYDDMAYYAMASDEFRNKKYREVFEKRLKDKVVLEIGPGSELTLTLLCLEAGVKRIYAVEIFPEAYEKAREKIKSLGLENKITLIHGDATRITLPEKVDYCVSEMVGSIGGSQGSALVINGVRKHLRNEEGMIPARSVSKIAAVTFSEEEFNFSFDKIGAHYVEKIFEKAGYPFDLRLCLLNFKKDFIISSEGIFEDLDYTKENALEGEHSFSVEIQQDSVLKGFVVWLELYIDEKTIINTLTEGKLWLPMYLPVFTNGEVVKKGDRVDMKVIRKLSRNQVNPDYFVSGTLYRQHTKPESFEHQWFNQEPRFRQNNFYQKVFHDKNARLNVEEEINSAELRKFLSNSLPPHMIPSYFLPLEKIPRTSSGKIDYRSLPDPQGKKTGKGTLTPPTDETESKIVQLWGEALEIDPKKIGIDDDFFELGGNSITILNVLSRMKKAFDQEIPFSSLFLYPTVRLLAENIQKEKTLNHLECIVQLNNSKVRKNLFIIHPMHGMVYQYKDLAQLLEDVFTVYGIQARGLTKRSPLAESMEVMIADYIHQIRTVQPEGPYLIAAHCFGDILSYNMVKEMELMGLKVERLIMFDEPAWIPEWVNWRFKIVEPVKKVIHFLKKPQKLIKKIFGINSLNPHEKIVQELELQLSAEKGKTLSPEEIQERKIKVHRNIKHLDQKYWGSHPFRRLKGIIKAPLLIIKAEERRNPRFAMKALKRMTYSKDIVLVETPGDHDTLFARPNVEKLAVVLKDGLKINQLPEKKLS